MKTNISDASLEKLQSHQDQVFNFTFKYLHIYFIRYFCVLQMCIWITYLVINNNINDLFIQSNIPIQAVWLPNIGY